MTEIVLVNQLILTFSPLVAWDEGIVQYGMEYNKSV